MTPRWERTRHLAHPVAMLAVDAVFVVVWLSAFASQAAYNSDDKCGKACGQSKAIVGLGVVATYVSVPALNALQPPLDEKTNDIPAPPG